MPLRNIEYLSKETGLCHRTVKKRLISLEPVKEDGPGRGTFYKSEEALALLYRPIVGDPANPEQRDRMTLTEARTRESSAKAHKVEIEIESLQRTRIPVEVMTEALDSAFGEIAAIIKKSGISEEDKEQIRAELRDIPKRLEW